MDVSEGNMFVAIALSCNLSVVLSIVRGMGDQDDSLNAMSCSARQELVMLVEVSQTVMCRARLSPWRVRHEADIAIDSYTMVRY
jgi:hypothetical protein